MALGSSTGGGGGFTGISDGAGYSGYSGDLPVGSSSGGIMEMLGGLLKDPQVLQSLGNTASQIARTQIAADKIPPHAKEMLKKAISGGIQQQQDISRLNPYGGDMTRFITPDMARMVLDANGIPYGRMNILV